MVDRFPGCPHWEPVSLSQHGPNVVDENNCLGRREGDWDRGAGYKSRFLVLAVDPSLEQHAQESANYQPLIPEFRQAVPAGLVGRAASPCT